MSMTPLYNESVTCANPLPNLWLISDARNDAALEAALARLPHGSALVFRHYHLDDAARRTRFDELAAAARAKGHLVILSGSAELAQAWGADGIYGAPESLSASLGAPSPFLRLATAHDAREIALANAAKADGVFLSPVFPTRSHPGGQQAWRLLL
jgi:thiamine-phosphate pyrophosphorylase